MRPRFGSGPVDKSLGIVPVSIKKEIVPFLVDQLRSTDPVRADDAIVDLSYLGPLAVDALPALQFQSRHAGSRESRRIDQAISLIRGGRPSVSEAELRDIIALPIMYREETHESPPEPPLVEDVSLKFIPPKRPLHVGQGVILNFEITTTASKKYGVDGRSYRRISIVRLDPDGVEHPVDIPVPSLSRGPFETNGGRSAGTGEIEVERPWREYDELSYGLILDQPGKYRLTADAIVALFVSSVPVHSKGLFSGQDVFGLEASSASARTNKIVAEFDILPRDQSASDRRLKELTADAMLLKDDEIFNKLGSMKFDEDELVQLIDYRAIPALLHIGEVAGNGTTGNKAYYGLGYFCDKIRLHRELLRDVKKNKRPHDEEEAGALAQILATTETIGCLPKKSESDVDFVRWDIARMRWDDWMMTRLHTTQKRVK